MSMESDRPVLVRSASAATTQSILLLHPTAAASMYSVRTTRTSPESSVPSRSGTPPAISFAPLPTIEPRKRRKSTHRPLGVAGRSEMIRRSHRHRDQYDYDYDAQPDYSYGDHERVSTNTEEDDALIELGRLVKKAGKNLFGKIGGHKKAKSREGEQAAQESNPEDVRESVDSEVKVPILLDDIQLAVWDGVHPGSHAADNQQGQAVEDAFDPTKTIRG